MSKAIKAGTVVEYHGSLEQFHGTYVANPMPTHPGRYVLRQEDGPELLLVRRASLTPVVTA